MMAAGKLLQQRYRIDRQIGQGGMGAVYIATDERFGSTVAIKETLCMDDSYRKAIEREARLLNSLKHSALPRVSDHFLEENGQFLVMEFIPGEDLYCIMERTGRPFAVGDVLRWADQLLDALDFLHGQENPVIHRDIKPQNLKLTARGQIILLDFGLAKGNPTDAGHHTAAKSIFGYSRNYASLEQIQGTGTDPRSDLYSLAATLYHLLTGRPPEDALTRAMAVLSRQPDPIVLPNILRPDVPPGVAAVLHRALDLNASGRPQSAAQMRLMLAEHHRYAELAESSGVRVGNIPVQAPLYAGTQGIDHRETATAVMPPNLSQVTSVRPGGIDTGDLSRPRAKSNVKRIAFAASALAALLLVATAAAGVFLYRPALFGRADSGARSGTEAREAPALEAEAANAAAESGGGSVQADSPVTETRPDTKETQRSLPKENDTARKNAPRPNNPGRQQPATDEDIFIDGDDVYVGNFAVRRNRGGQHEPPTQPRRDKRSVLKRAPAIPDVPVDLIPDKGQKFRTIYRMYPNKVPLFPKNDQPPRRNN
jgi:serine/threonine protein kinase